MVPVPLAAALGCCQLSGSLFLHIDKIVPIWYFSWVLIFFLFFFGCCFVFIKKKKKAPLQSVIPINIIHLKNSIYIFIYIFLYIYFYVHVLASCHMSISVGVGDVGFYSTLISKSALHKRCPKNPETSSKEVSKKKNLAFKTYIQLLQSL